MAPAESSRARQTLHAWRTGGSGGARRTFSLVRNFENGARSAAPTFASQFGPVWGPRALCGRHWSVTPAREGTTRASGPWWQCILARAGPRFRRACVKARRGTIPCCSTGPPRADVSTTLLSALAQRRWHAPSAQRGGTAGHAQTAWPPRRCISCASRCMV